MKRIVVVVPGCRRLIQSCNVQRAGHTRRLRVQLRSGQCQIPRAVTSHGKTGDKRLLPLPAHRKYIADEERQFLRKEGLVLFPAPKILIKRIFRGCHDNHNPPVLRIAVNIAVAHPGKCVAVRSVQQIQHRKPVLVIVLRAVSHLYDLLTAARRWNEHVQRNIAPQGRAVIVCLHQCHCFSPYPFLSLQLWYQNRNSETTPFLLNNVCFFTYPAIFSHFCR